MKTQNYKKSNGTTGYIQLNENEEVVVVNMKEAEELQVNEEPMLTPGLVGNANTDPDLDETVLEHQSIDDDEEKEEPLLPTGIKAE